MTGTPVHAEPGQAEPSARAGLDGSPDYVLHTNLVGTLNCLAFARRRVGAFVFLSTSRVYSIAPLRQIVLDETPTRFEIAAAQTIPGVSPGNLRELPDPSPEIAVRREQARVGDRDP